MATIKEQKRDKPKHSEVSQMKDQGGPKKGGAGKHGWGKPGDEITFVYALGKDDPNYDSEEDYDYALEVVEADEDAGPSKEEAEKTFANAFQQISAFKASLKIAVEEYLLSFDRDEFVRCIRDLRATMFHHEIPKLAITLSLDKTEEQRKKISLLLQFLFQHDIVSTPQMETGFRHLFNRLSDLALDVPNAETLLKQFLGRAVAAEYLSEATANSIAESTEKLKDPQEVAQAKKHASDLANEFFDNEDLAEAELRLTELKQPHFHHIVVKQIVSMSLDRSNRERELASYFLATLAGSTLQSSEVEKGFEILLGRVDDLFNDVPKVLDFLSCFLARAVADECLPPAFLARFNLPEQDLATQVIQQAIAHLHKKHASARLAKVWGPGDGRSVPQLKKAVRELVTEYFESSDLEEAKKCVKDLNAPYFSHEVIHRIVVLTSDRKDREIELASALIKALLKEQIVSERQARMGFARVQAALNDLKLDAPNASDVFAKIQAAVGLN